MKMAAGALVVLLGLGVVADFVARGAAETRVAARLQRSLDLTEEPEVEIGGFPFLLNLLAGSIPSVEVSSSSVARGALRFDEVVLTLDNVRFDLGAMSRGEGEVRIGGGRGRAVMSGESLTALLRAEGAPVDVRFSGGRVLVDAEGPAEEAEGRLSLDGRRLVVSSGSLPQDFSVALPRVGSGVSYRSVEVGKGLAQLVLALKTGTLEV